MSWLFLGVNKSRANFKEVLYCSSEAGYGDTNDGFAHWHSSYNLHQNRKEDPLVEFGAYAATLFLLGFGLVLSDLFDQRNDDPVFC